MALPSDCRAVAVALALVLMTLASGTTAQAHGGVDNEGYGRPASGITKFSTTTTSQPAPADAAVEATEERPRQLAHTAQAGSAELDTFEAVGVTSLALPTTPDAAFVARCVRDPQSHTGAGLAWDRRQWCQHDTMEGDITDPRTGKVLGTVGIEYTMVAYADPVSRRVRVFFRGENYTTTGTYNFLSLARIRVACVVAQSGCSVDRGWESRRMYNWNNNDWIAWTITSDERWSTAADRVLHHQWHLLGQSRDSAGNVTSPGAQTSVPFRCDSATYFNGAPKACVHSNVAPVLTYRRSGDGVDEVAAHISKAQNSPDSTYPTMRNHAKHIPGKYLGAEGALHRIPYHGAEWLANQAEKNRACERRGRYRHTGLPDPAGGWLGKDCDEYPFASTLEGANSPRYDFSVEAVTATQNSRAGTMLTNFYRRERVLYRQDAFYVQIT